MTEKQKIGSEANEAPARYVLSLTAHPSHEPEAAELARRVHPNQVAADKVARGLIEGGPELNAAAELAGTEDTEVDETVYVLLLFKSPHLFPPKRVDEVVQRCVGRHAVSLDAVQDLVVPA